MSIKLEQYKIFNEAASTLSFSTAARNLFVSQSAISQAILSLEKELDTKLFIRLPKGVALTTEGLLLQQQITQALSLITSVENELASYKTLSSGQLRIGAGDTVSKYFVLSYLTTFHKLYPGVSIKVINRTSHETIDLLKTGQIDLAFVNMPLIEEGVTIEPCFVVHDIFVSSNKDTTIYSYNDLAKKDLIMLETSSASRNFVDKVFSENGVLIHPSIELGSHDLLLDFAKSDLGIACIIKEFAKNELDSEELYPLTLKKPIPARTLGYAYLQRRALPLAASKFLELLKENSCL